MVRKFRWIVSTEKEQEWKLYFLRNKIVTLHAGEEEENLPFLLRFCLNQTRGCARIDITSGKYLLRLILQKTAGDMFYTKEKGVTRMLIEVDFNSDEAIYIQLCNQIILGIAMSDIQEGDSLPSVRQLADTVGVNMHTVNKAYHVLKREGYISLDKRRGAVIAVDVDKLQQLEVMKEQLRIVLARGRCKNISRQEVHELVDEIFDEYEVHENR